MGLKHVDTVFLIHYNLDYVFVVRVLADLCVVFVADFKLTAAQTLNYCLQVFDFRHWRRAQSENSKACPVFLKVFN